MILGIAPDDCEDMIETVAIAATLGAFPDMSAHFVQLMNQLSIQWGESLRR